jgi:hypothetical protein
MNHSLVQRFNQRKTIGQIVARGLTLDWFVWLTNIRNSAPTFFLFCGRR